MPLKSYSQHPLSFKDDLSVLQKHFSPMVLTSSDGRSISVLKELQGRIIHAGLSGYRNISVGWIKRDYLKQNKIELKSFMGGVDRLWFGPDGGKYSVFFDPGVETKTKNIRPPKALSTDEFDLESRTKDSALFSHQFSFRNHLGSKFDVGISREVSVLSKLVAEKTLAIEFSNQLEWTAYESRNTVTNKGVAQWTSAGGLFSIWVLGMFEPSATVVIPLRGKLEHATNYFVPASDKQVRIIGSTLFYCANAMFMNKVGVPIANTLPIIGSYNTKRNMLTLLVFSIDRTKTDYVNAVWDWDALPLDGEIVNIFNDGPQAQENGKPFGPFYELETSSAALDLAPNKSATHVHTTFHFVGERRELDRISKASLGVSLAQIEQAFTTNHNK